ncbi:MAG: adenylate/guanylate cyclase domain-containing protein [Dehalococcoidia bacterium]
MSVSLTPYFPRLLIEWLEEAPGATWRERDGSLVFADISGFTAMSERLARKGKVGAEEVTEVMSGTFARLLAAAYAQGAYLLKFGGDAMFLLFTGDEHAARACRASVDMRRALREAGVFTTSAGEVGLRMSVGVHSGRIVFVLAGASHRELLVVGEAVTQTARMESTATAGQIVVSAATAALIPARCVGERAGDGFVLKQAPAAATAQAAPMTVEAFAASEQFIPLAVRAQLVAGIDESEHRAVRIAFVHFGGTDELLASAGPEAVAGMLDRLVRRVQESAEAYKVCFLATDVDTNGGKIILTAGAPTGGENDDERMLRAVRNIVDASGPLRVRAGVHRGHIFVGNVGPPYRRTYTVMGDAVNLAARLMAKAQPGQILATREVLDGSHTLFETEEVAPFTVKGKARPVTAYSIGRIAGPRGRRESGRLRLAGRARELEQLVSALRSVEASGARLIEVVGDPGIGKSRLVRELRARCEEVAYFEAVCEQYESSTAYLAFARLLRATLGIDARAGRGRQAAVLRERVTRDAPGLLPWLPLIAAVLDVPAAPTREVTQIEPAFRQGRLHRAVADLLLRVLPRPSLLVIEDAHWIDEASRALLAYMLASAGEAPWLWCTTRRAGVSAVNFDDIPGAASIELEPLAGAEASRLAADAAGEVALPQHELDALASRAGGNPLFLQELVAVRVSGAGMQGLPESVEALVVARIDALAPEDRRALRYAAILGGAFQREWLAGSFGELLGADDGAARWQRLDKFIVAEDGGGLRFRHALVREVAYETLPFRLRHTLHERAGAYFERIAGDDTDGHAELLSLHFSLARDHAKAYRYSRVAGERAKGKWANVEAAEFFRRAIAAARQTPGVERHELATVSEALGDVCELAGLYDDAIEAYRTSRELARDEAPIGRRLLMKEGVLRERVGRYAPALRWYTRALRACAPTDIADRVKISVAYAGVRFRQGRYGECAAWLRRVLPEAEACGDRASLAHAYYLLAHACTFLGSGEGGRYRALALPIYEELGDLVGQANVLNNLGVAAYYYEGNWDDAMHYYRRSRAARERAGDVVGAATASNNMGEILSDQGLFDDARALFRSALDVWRAARYPVGVALATSNLGLTAARAGDVAGARGLLDEALHGFREIRADSFIFETEARLAEVALLAGDGEAARTAIEALIRRSGRIDGVARVVPMLYRLLAEAWLQDGDGDAARRAVDASIATARSSGAEYELMLALAVAALHGLAPAEQGAAYLDESEAIRVRLGVLATPGVDIAAEQARAR